MKIKRVHERVKRIMEENPEARDNDGLLISLIDAEINPAVSGMTYSLVMANRTALGLPPCESIRRSRQKAQEQTPSLTSSRGTSRLRSEQRKEYEDFVRAK